MKRCILFFMAVIMIISLSACKPTPKESIVKEKNLDRMIEDATKDQPEVVDTPLGNGIAERMRVESTCVKELVDVKDKVKIHVNAAVVVPDTDQITVQRVGQGEITQAQLDILLSQLMKGDLISGSAYQPSKSEIQIQIDQVQSAINKVDPQSEGSSRKTLNSEWLQYQLESLQGQLASAPNETVIVPSDGKFAPMDADMGSGKELYVLAQPSVGGYQSMHVYNYDDGVSFLEYTWEENAFAETRPYYQTKDSLEEAYRDGQSALVSQEELADIPELKLPQADAKRMADALVAELGLQGLTLYSQDIAYGGSMDLTLDQSAYVNPPQCVWLLRYARAVNGIPVTYTVYDCMKVEEENQSSPWAYEDLTVAITDKGIVGFNWRSPYQATDIITENANVLSYQDAMNVFDTMALVVNAWEGYSEWNPDLVNIEIDIDRIQFGLTRVTEQNKRDSGLLVPCWDFFGTVNYIFQRDGELKTMKDGPVPVLTINAIDGSIINRNLGY